MPGTATDQAGAGHSKASGHTKKMHIFVSYKRDAEPDDRVATGVHEALEKHHKVFIDKDMEVGELWAERIEQELRRSDYLITFLSAESVHSEMVLAEIETAHRLAKEQGGHPRILPVRLAYRELFKYPLSAYLNPINWAFWEGPEDTPRLIKEIQQAISDKKLTIATQEDKDKLVVKRSLELEPPGGAMSSRSDFYVERGSDKIALSEIRKRGGAPSRLKAPGRSERVPCCVA